MVAFDWNEMTKVDSVSFSNFDTDFLMGFLPDHKFLFIDSVHQFGPGLKKKLPYFIEPKERIWVL